MAQKLSWWEGTVSLHWRSILRDCLHWRIGKWCARRIILYLASSTDTPYIQEHELVCFRVRGVLGERKFNPKQWQCSVLDSVVGAILTQNVTDALSSKAFMTMTALFPPARRRPLNETWNHITYPLPPLATIRGEFALLHQCIQFWQQRSLLSMIVRFILLVGLCMRGISQPMLFKVPSSLTL